MYTGKRSYPGRQAQSNDQDLLGRDQNVPLMPTVRQGTAKPQPEGHRHTGLTSVGAWGHMYRQRADGFLTTCPFKTLAKKLNEAD